MKLETIKRRAEALQGALNAWEKAPAHVKVMAGAYVGPLLLALGALGEEVEEQRCDLLALSARVANLEGADHGA